MRWFCILRTLEVKWPRQAWDAEEGRKLLLLDENALFKAVKEGDDTKVMLIPALVCPCPPRERPDCKCAFE